MKPRIWSEAINDTMQTLVLVDGVFYSDNLAAKKFIEMQEAIEEDPETDPAEFMGKKHQRADLDAIAVVTAKSTGSLVIENNKKVLIKTTLGEHSIKILELIEKLKGDGWSSEIHNESRIWAALASLGGGLLFGAVFVWVYFGIISGKIDRIHWLVAFMVNTFGPSSALVLGGLIFLGGMAGFGYYLTHPAEVWTLEEE